MVMPPFKAGKYGRIFPWKAIQTYLRVFVTQLA